MKKELKEKIEIFIDNIYIDSCLGWDKMSEDFFEYLENNNIKVNEEDKDEIEIFFCDNEEEIAIQKFINYTKIISLNKLITLSEEFERDGKDYGVINCINCNNDLYLKCDNPDCDNKLFGDIYCHHIEGEDYHNHFCSLDCVKTGHIPDINSWNRDDTDIFYGYSNIFSSKKEGDCICNRCLLNLSNNRNSEIKDVGDIFIPNECSNCGKKLKDDTLCTSYEHFCSMDCLIEKQVIKTTSSIGNSEYFIDIFSKIQDLL